MTLARTAYVPQIDALRALTIITVMVYHINAAWIPGGFAAVDIFFTISGYVISRSMLELDARRLSTFVSGFYARRVLRIVPALLVILLVTSVATTLFVPLSWLSSANYITASYAFWGFGNYGLLNSGDAYFAPRIDFNPFAHTWSLGVEEQFYLVFPVVFFLWLRFQERKSASRHAGTVLLSLLFVVSLSYSAYASRHAPSLAFYLLPSRFWELAAGGLLFQLHANNLSLAGRRPGPQAAQLMVAFGFFVLAFVLSRETAFPFPWALLAVAGTIVAIDAVTPERAPETGLARWMRNPALVWIGRLSYSLYLWHWPIYALFHWTVGMESWTTRIVAVALTVLLSWITYTWVENPIRRGPLKRSPHRVLVVAGGLASMLLVARAGAYLHVREGELTRSVTRNRVSWYPVDVVEQGKAGSGPCSVSSSEVPLPTGGAVNRYYRKDCADSASIPRLFVTGDSHAEAYRTLLSMVAASGAFDVRIYFLSGCTPFKLHDPVAVSSAVCKAFYRGLLRDVGLKHQRGDILFLPSLRVPRLGDQWALFSEASALAQLRSEGVRRSREQAIDEAYGDLKTLLDDGVRVVFEAPTPIFRAPAYRCSDWFNRGNPICATGLTISRNYVLDFRRPVLESLRGLARRHTGISIWDPFETLCSSTECAAVVNGAPLFFDGDHLSGDGNRLLFPGFREFVERQHAASLAGG